MDQRGTRRSPSRPTWIGTRRAGSIVRAACVARRRPLQQPGAGEQHPSRGAHDRIETEAGLIGEAHEREAHLQRRAGLPRCATSTRCWPSSTSRGLRNRSNIESKQRWHRDDPDDRQRPEPCRRQHRPAQQQQQCHARRHQAAPQVVEDLPARQGRERIALPAPAGAGNARQQPARKLPVAANPAVAPADVRAGSWKGLPRTSCTSLK